MSEIEQFEGYSVPPKFNEVKERQFSNLLDEMDFKCANAKCYALCCDNCIFNSDEPDAMKAYGRYKETKDV